jgi:hypothetical protein
MIHTFGDYFLRDWREEDAPSLARYINNRRIRIPLRDAFPLLILWMMPKLFFPER